MVDSTEKELKATCDNIVKRLEDYAEGKYRYCPSCEGYEDKDGLKARKRKKCPECGEEIVEKTLSVWLDDVLDVRFTVGRDGSVLGGSICVGFGGPNIWVDTMDACVKGYWGFDGKARSNFSYALRGKLDDALEQLYDCIR